MGLIKNFKVTERFNANVRAEVFNLTNTPQYTNGSFNTFLNFNAQGKADSTASNPAQTRFSSERQMQLVLRVDF
jgi:hypothetical protein